MKAILASIALLAALITGAQASNKACLTSAKIRADNASIQNFSSDIPAALAQRIASIVIDEASEAAQYIPDVSVVDHAILGTLPTNTDGVMLGFFDKLDCLLLVTTMPANTAADIFNKAAGPGV